MGPHVRHLFRFITLAALCAPACCKAPLTEPAVQSAQVTSTGAQSSISPQARAAADHITGDYLREQIATFSADEFAGRGPTTAADSAARGYLIEQLKQLNFAPGGPNGSYEQPFEILGMTAHLPEAWTFRAGEQSIAFRFRQDYVANSGVQTEAGGSLTDAEVVFVGYGIEAPEYEWDDFKGQDVRGKVLLMLNNDPDWDPQLFAGDTRLYYGRWTYKYESAARQGAAGAIIIHTTASAGYPFQVVQTSWTGEQFELPQPEGPKLQVKGWLSESAASSLVQLAGHDLGQLITAARDRNFKPIPLGVTTSLAFKNTVHRSTTANVIGILPGRDAAQSQEYVVYTAHHDHLGVGEPDASGDNIYNGALDNAAGVAQVLAIGRAWQALGAAPARSIMLLFVGAEEQGLLGSEYYVKHPTVAPGRFAANINFDGGNIWGRARDLVYVGQGKSTLDGYVNAIAREQGRRVTPDQFPDRGHFYRSDQFNFAKVGVPALYLDAGTDFIGREPGWGKAQHVIYEEQHYHQPSDEIDPSWNFEGMVEDAQLGFFVGFNIANSQEMPSWLPGDEFEAARKAALSSLSAGSP